MSETLSPNDPALVAFIAHCDKLRKVFNPKHSVEFECLKSFIRVFAKDSANNRSAYAFIAIKDGNTRTLGSFKKGDVFKATGWQGPAKNVRGSIYSAVIDFCDWHGAK